MKPYQRLAYSRIADVLADRNLVEPQVLKDALGASQEDGLSFPLVLVDSNHITEWELAALVCETYGLPFLPLDICPPDPSAMKGIDVTFLDNHLLVPIARNGKVLTVTMPCITPADVLVKLEEMSDCNVLPVVGTIYGNRDFMRDFMKDHKPEHDEGWSSIFDEADAAVLMDIDEGDVAPPPISGGLDPKSAPVRKIERDQPVASESPNLPPPPSFGGGR